MDISPLYELRARLRAAMIAGTGLLSEDFRLKRAVEAFAPLEQASPVFAKIGQLAGTLLSPDTENSEDALLDAITLADAVLCTQGTVAAEGKVAPLAGNGRGSAVTNAPYSVVRTLTEALLTSGSGHYSYVVESYRDRPELFRDYRIRTAMIQALGASYAELADTVAEWLKKEDPSILPLLQKDFNPKGKKETVRRIHVMSAIDARSSNEFFVKILPDAEKEVRQALIFALRHCPENTDLLLELIKTEKGSAKKTAYYALAYMEDERAEAVFTELYKKKPGDAMAYLIFTETKWGARFVAEKLKEQLLPWSEGSAEPEVSPEQEALLGEMLAALPGKSGTEICEVFRIAANLENLLKLTVNGRKVMLMASGVREVITAGLNIRNRESIFTFQTAIPYLLHQALHCHPDEELCALALELYEAKGRGGGRRKAYFPAALAAQLLTAGDCCDWLEEQLKEKLFQSDAELSSFLTRGIDGLQFSEKENAYVLRIERFHRTHPSGNLMPEYCQPVKQDITRRFTDIITRYPDRDMDRVLMNCINTGDEAYCRKLGDYFYSRALELHATRDYLLALKSCRYPKCEGLAVSEFTRTDSYPHYFSEISGYAPLLPGNKTAICEELQRVYDLYKQGQLHFRDSSQNEAQFLNYLEGLKNS
ncbi:MAG: HEAT repeat domain-containing protein [Acetatifactor sp.]|nr:HEAT repeat domain-containing protein [Acetatifactor sp.]